ncbi:hypothetical protein AURDEDRAFT_172872 [Auricularia subglabra TFB-10046 SS5]|uniref:Uncharacterized protein n=1 Tax=Auricularia subglabra (strain TFB-10046 / SS5) TaxID=717982 RepID=J0DBP3_AURST|nr:hypothetical protein AURDEDRAFT_172872 [Auricularia subglabra TFB-10046 SS5]
MCRIISVTLRFSCRHESNFNFDLEQYFACHSPTCSQSAQPDLYCNCKKCRALGEGPECHLKPKIAGPCAQCLPLTEDDVYRAVANGIAHATANGAFADPPAPVSPPSMHIVASPRDQPDDDEWETSSFEDLPPYSDNGAH